MTRKIKKNNKGSTEEKIKNKFSLNQDEVHQFGRLLLNDINSVYKNLKDDVDIIWSLELDLELFKKLSEMVVGLQNGKILIVYDKEDKNKK